MKLFYGIAIAESNEICTLYLTVSFLLLPLDFFILQQAQLLKNSPMVYLFFFLKPGDGVDTQDMKIMDK